MIKKTIIAAVQDVISQLTGEKVEIILSVPIDLSHGDYTTNIAFQLAKTTKKSPFVVAQEIVSKLNAFISSEIEKVEVAQPGFINFWISKEYLLNELQHFIADANGAGTSATLQGVKILVEYAHPNTHKEMHLGHMRTLITGEALSRLLESQGAKVFRANYQGDIGPHVAKAMVGIQELMHKDQISLEQILSRSSKEKAHFLGKGYVEGNKLYQEGKRKNEKRNKIITKIGYFLFHLLYKILYT